ncbi:MAG TPA: AMP-binding protein [Pyrinomonadaceae bacterium]|nr:AMP-binding protein [Pyrinomonadaceae bacterium]
MEKFETPYVAITDAIASLAKWRPDRTALVCEDQRLTWREFNQAIDRVANGLIKGGLRKGDKVSVLMLNSIEMLEIMMGTVKAGGVIVPLSVMLTAESLATMISDSDSRFIFVGAPFARVIDSIRRDLLNISSEGFFVVGDETEGWIDYQRWRDEFTDAPPQVRLTPEDDFNLIYSSGTTGTPKGIAHTHYARQQTAYILAIEFRFDLNSIAVITTPLFANGTWIMMLPSLTVGSTLVVMPQFDPKKFLDIVERERATHTFMVPTQYIVTMDVPEFDRFDLSSLKTLLSAGAPLRADTKARMLQSFGGGVFELYGLTEGIATRLRPEEMESKLASVGTTIFGGDIRIIDDAGSEVPRGEAGEIVGYSSALMRGYYKKPEETAAAVWKDEMGRTYLRTGDVGKLDEDGFLYILDRKKDMILSGGVNVFPKDIEDVVARHEAVADVAVIGIPHEKWGETPLAIVVRKKGSTSSTEELRDWTNARLAKHQRIAGIEFRDGLPRNALGKVLKKELREPYWRSGTGSF